jgi:hypothetical protein
MHSQNFYRALLSALILAATAASAADFTSGNLIVSRAGTGAAPLSGGTAVAVFLDEYTPAGALVQTISLPTADSGSNSKFAVAGSNEPGRSGAEYEGALALSANGRYLTLAGYAASPGDAASAFKYATSATCNRVVARVDFHAAIDTTTRISDGFDSDGVRAAITTDGSVFWAGGQSTNNTGGVRYVTLGSTGASTRVAGISGMRTLAIFRNQLYAAFGMPTTDTGGISITSDGLPTVVTNIANLAGLTLDKPGGVFFSSPASGQFVLYVADQTHGLLKYSSTDATTWTARGSVAGALVGLTGALRSGGVDLYATIGTASGDTLAALTDTAAWNMPLTGTFTTLATATANTSLRGIVFAPEEKPVALQSAAAATPVVAGIGQPVTFTAAATGGGAPLAYLWNFGDSSSGTGATTTHGYTAAGTYTAEVTITDDALSVTSSVSVTVKATLTGEGNDSDGDGFSDAIETAAGTSATDSTSTPFAGAPAPAPQALTLTAMGIKLNFKSPFGNDSISLSGTLPVPPGTSLANQQIVLDVGGVIQAFKLDPKGKGPKGNAKIVVSKPSKTNTSKFSIKLSKGTYAKTLAPYNLANVTTTTTAVVALPVTVLFNKGTYADPSVKLLYKSKIYASGTAKK